MNGKEKLVWLWGIRETKRGARYEFCDIRLQGLFKSRRAPRFFFQRRIPRVAAPLCFPNRYSLLASVMVDTLCPWYTRNHCGLWWGELAARTERGSWCEIVLEGASPLFRCLASRCAATTMSKRQDCNGGRDIFFLTMVDCNENLFLKERERSWRFFNCGLFKEE